MKYKFLEHTADAKFRAYGKTLEEAFSNAALAMFSIIVNTGEIEKNVTKEIKIKASDLNSLLYKWLEELLFFLDAKFFFLNNVDKIKIDKSKNYTLKAVVIGDKFKEKYELFGSVKAVTYNEMFVKCEKNKVILQVVLDI